MSCASLVLLASVLLPQNGREPGAEPPEAPEPAASEAPDSRSWWRPEGWLDLWYEGRWTDGEHDNDLHAYGRLSFGDEDSDALSAELSGRGVVDVDRDRDPGFVFRSLEDSRSGDATGYLYTAFVDLNGVDDGPLPTAIRRVRLGRQVLYDTPVSLFLDGASVETAPLAGDLDLVLTAYAGLPSNIFESSPSGDVTGGVAVSVAPWTGARLRADYLHITDRWLGATAHDDLLGLRLDQRLGRSWTLDAHANLLEGEGRDAGAGVVYQDGDADLRLVGRYTALWQDQRFHAIELDAYTPLLGTHFAYHQLELSGYKGLGDHPYLEAGVQARELADGGDEGVFNHEFQRYFATAGVAEWPWPGLDVSVTGELWDSHDDRFTSFGAAAIQELGERWRLALGTFFQLFRYDALRAREDEDVQVTYAKARYRLAEGLHLRLALEYEDAELGDFLEVETGLRIDF